MTAPYRLNPQPGDTTFPAPSLALTEPNGLLAVGGDLSAQRLLSGYRVGIFPWYSSGEPILWWSPAPRAVLRPEALHISRSLQKRIRQGHYTTTIDHSFSEVIECCSQPRLGRAGGGGTWIVPAMRQAYVKLHRLGFAHSAECWMDGKLVGGLYGVALGQIFFGESMFSLHADASKVAFVHLVQQLQRKGFMLIDCQITSAHLTSLGATEISRPQFQQMLDQYADPMDLYRGSWAADETHSAPHMEI